MPSVTALIRLVLCIALFLNGTGHDAFAHPGGAGHPATGAAMAQMAHGHTGQAQASTACHGHAAIHAGHTAAGEGCGTPDKGDCCHGACDCTCPPHSLFVALSSLTTPVSERAPAPAATHAGRETPRPYRSLRPPIG